MTYQDESDLKYIDQLDNIPITGDMDPWSPDKKLQAAEAGESKLEADVNEGDTISGYEHIHSEAAATWATYRLVVGFKSPDSTTRGDSLDEGAERMQFARELKSMYNDLVNSIVSAQGDASSGGPGAIGFDVIDITSSN